MSVFDPSSLIEKRVKEELAPLRKRLDEASSSRERRTIKRLMLRREREIRNALSGNGVAW